MEVFKEGKLSPEFRTWMDARSVIECVEIRRVFNIGSDENVIVGRDSASRIMKALNDAGYEVIRKLEQK